MNQKNYVQKLRHPLNLADLTISSCFFHVHTIIYIFWKNIWQLNIVYSLHQIFYRFWPFSFMIKAEF